MNQCPVCKSTETLFKFGKLYMCKSCKNHYYGTPPTVEQQKQSAEEVLFEERIQERTKRKEGNSIEMEILKLAAEARAEQEEFDPSTDYTEPEEKVEPTFKPMKSAGRPRKVK